MNRKLDIIKEDFENIYETIKDLEKEFGKVENVEAKYYPYFYNKYDICQPTAQLSVDYEKGYTLVLFSGLYYRSSEIETAVHVVKTENKEEYCDFSGICYPEKTFTEKYLSPETIEDIETVLWDEKNEFDWACERILKIGGVININTTINLNNYSTEDRKVIEKALDIMRINY